MNFTVYYDSNVMSLTMNHWPITAQTGNHEPCLSHIPSSEEVGYPASLWKVGICSLLKQLSARLLGSGPSPPHIAGELVSGIWHVVVVPL